MKIAVLYTLFIYVNLANISYTHAICSFQGDDMNTYLEGFFPSVSDKRSDTICTSLFDQYYGTCVSDVYSEYDYVADRYDITGALMESTCGFMVTMTTENFYSSCGSVTVPGDDYNGNNLVGIANSVTSSIGTCLSTGCNITIYVEFNYDECCNSTVVDPSFICVASPPPPPLSLSSPPSVLLSPPPSPPSVLLSRMTARADYV